MLPWLQHRWTGLWLLILALGALILFLYGFFPLKYHSGKLSHMDDLPNFIDGVSIDGQEVYNAGENSVILMVIDGLRYDFATEEYMPYTGELLKNKSACIYVSVAEPPTVTMPRIKICFVQRRYKEFITNKINEEYKTITSLQDIYPKKKQMKQ